jgi:uncharacterized repeat protein (TIGR01451 family)
VTPQQADLAVGKQVSDPTPNVNETITYTVTVANDGPNAATNVTLQDVLPTGVQYQSSTASEGSYLPGTSTWTVGTVAVGVTETLTITALVVSPNPQTNTASISHSDQFDPDTNNNSATASINPLQADLEVTKTVNNPTPNVGDTVTFTVALTNNGPSTATGVEVTDLLPTGLSYVSSTPSQGSYSNITGVWMVGTVAATAVPTLQIQAMVVSANAETNTATVSAADQFDPDPGNNTASTTVTPQQADLALTKIVNDPTPNVGDTVTFTVALTNNGPDPATNVTVNDPLPAGLTLVSATPSQGTYTGGVWTVGTVALSAAPTLTISAMVVSPNAETNTATINHSDQFDPNSSNNSANATVTPQQSDLALAKTVSDATPNVGDTVTFTVTLTNNGTDPATNVTVGDALPAGLSLVSATPSQGTYTGGVWTVGTVAVSASPTLIISALVLSPNAETNTATISHSDQFDPDTSNNSAQATVTPQQADLALAKTVNDPTPNVGETVTFTVSLTNKGPDAATNVSVADALPSGLTLVSATPSQGSYTGGVWTVGTVAPSAVPSLIINALVVSPGAETNTATISHSDQFDPNTSNNSAQATVTPQQADLALAKTVNDPTPNVGDNVTFIVTLTNQGPDAATNVSVADALPAGLTLVSATPSQGTYTGGVWTVGTVALSAAPTLTITAMVVSPGAETNTATISHADQFDPDAGNNSAAATVTPQQADLVVGKLVSDPTPNVGETITYTVTVANNGPDAATNVALQDILPTGVQYQSSTATEGSFDPTSTTWTVGTVAVGVTETLTITALVVSPNPQANTASISHSDQFDPNASNNSDTASIVPLQADLELTKTVNDPTPNVGDTVTFIVSLTNNGPSAATGVEVTDLLPAGLSFISATPSQGSYVSSTGLWTVGTVAAAAVPTLQIQATVVSANAETNTATISHSDQFDPDPGNNTASSTVTPQQADLALTKMVNDATPNVGDTVTFTVALSNIGPDAATNVTVADVLPAGLTLVSSMPSQGTYTGGVWTVGTVTPSAAPTLTLTATVVSPNAETNTATITHSDQFDGNPTNNQASATVTPQQADLALAKTVNDPTPNVGDTVTFTVTLTNHGPNDATNVSVADALPTGLTLVSALPSQGSYTGGVWTVGTVAASATPTLTLAALVVSANAETNTATVNHADQFDPNTGNNSAAATVTPQQADLAVGKQVSDPTPNVGETITYTITVANDGPDTATNVTLQDVLPAGVSYQSSTASQGSFDPTSRTWTVGTVAVGVTDTLTITALVVSPSPQTNTASISHSDQFDPNTNNNSDTASIVPLQADLELTKTVNDPTPNVGGTVTFTVSLTNNGPSAATGVAVTDLLPAGLSFESATPSQGSYSSTTGVWMVGPVAAAAVPTLQIQATVVSASAETNTATISASDQFDPDPGNNTASTTVTPQQADLVLAKMVNDPTPNVGDTVTFTIGLTNLGPDPATNVTVADALPAGLTLVSSTPSQGTYSGGVWTVGTVALTAAPTLTITALVVSAGAETNTASISHADQFDPDTSNNTASATVTPQQADLALTKTVNDATPNVGDTVTFTVGLTNQGPDTATNVSVADTLPAGLTLVSATPSLGSYAAGVWTVGTLTPLAPQTLTLTALVVSAGAETNTATISHSDQFDPNTNNNTASATVTPQQADLALAKTVNDPTPNVGDTVTFTVTLTNNGPDAATNVSVADALPSGLSLVTATPSQGTYAGGVWTVGTVALSAAPTLTLTALVVSPNAETNTATISHSDQFDPNSGNNSGNATVTPQQSDLALTKTVSDATPNVGGTITFTVTLTNNGPDAATNVQVTDLLPAGLTFVSATPSQGSYNSGSGLWTVGTVATTATPTLHIQATVVSPNAETNTATISHSDQFDPDSGNNSGNATVTPQQSDLALTKTVSDATPNVGDTVSFTVTLTNNGPDAATNVQVTDLLPAGLTFVSATPSQGSYNSGSGLWTVGAVATTAMPTLQIQATVVSPNAETNTATISHADQFDPNTGNNSGNTTVTPQQADLALSKTVSNATPNVGDTITFTVTLTNHGPDPATNVQVSDLLPAGLTFVSSTPSQGSYSRGTGLWTVGTVAANATPTLQIQATVVSPNAQTNTATISHSDQFDPDSGNNTGSATETPQQSDLALSKTVSNATPNVGDTITFTVTLTNNGPDAATGVQVTDLLPAGLTFVSSTPSQGSYSSVTGVWTVGAVGKAATPTLQIQAMVVSPSAETNTTTISHADQFDPDTGNNNASATVTPQQSDLALSKSVSDATPNVGDTVTFTVTLANDGPDAATNVQVSDLLPAGLTFVSATPSQGSYSSATGVWSVGTVAKTAAPTLKIHATVVSANAETNTATISHSDQFDPNTSNNSADATVTPQQSDLALSKTVSNATPNVGDTITFTVTLTNNGPDAATGVQVSDLLPGGLSFVSATPSQGSYASTTGLWTVGTVATTVAPTLLIRATVLSPAAEINTATISHADQFDPDPGNNQGTATVTPQQADLVVGKRVSDPTPNVGETITYTVTVGNNGPDAATDVTLQDVLPSGVSYQSSTATEGSFNPVTRTWTVGTVAVGVTQTLTITAKVTSPNPQANTASISHSDQFDPDVSNNSDTASIVPTQADLELAKMVNNPTPNVGDTVTFTVSLTNNGPSDATNVQVSDLLPAGLTFVSSTPSQGTYSSTTGFWTVGTVAMAATPTLQIQATVVSPNAETNTATISHSDQFDPDTGNNTASTTVTPQQSDLVLTKTVDDATPNVGDTVTFTVTLANHGPDPATNVTVADALPAGLSLISSTPSQGTYTGGVWTVGTVSLSVAPTLTLTARVVSPNAETNTATISHSDQFDPDTGNNSGNATVTPQQSDLALTKTVNDATPNVGDTVTFTVTLTNNGPDTASGVQVSDLLPAGLTFVSATPSQGSYSGATGLWTVGTVTTAVAPTLQIRATLVSSSPQTNTVTISHSDQFDPNTGNNSANVTVAPQQSDLALTKTVNDPTPNVGDTVTFTVTLTNLGPDAATNVTVNDALPAGLTLVSALPSQGSYAAGVWTVGTVSTSVAPTLQIQAMVVSPNAETNTATISASDQFDPNTSNNTADTTVTPQQSDLALNKTVNDATPNVGDTVTFTVNLTNNGPDPATNVQVTDLLPAGLTFVSATPSQGGYNSATGLWTVGTVTTATAPTLQIHAMVVSPNAQTNTATISHSDQFDPDSNNNQASATETPQQSDLALSKSVNDATPNVGDTVTFTVTLANHGPDPATNVQVNDLLPAGLSFVSATPSQGSYSSATGVWMVGAVSTTAAPTLQIQATVVSPSAETNTATISHSDQFDPNAGNNSADATVTPQQSDLALTKTVNDATPNVGDTVTFTVTLANHGPDAATGVQVSDLLPAGLTFVSATPSQGSYSSATGLWSVGTVATTATPTLQIQATVVSPNAETNTAAISHSDQFDPNTGNNSANTTVTPQQSDLALTKTVSDATPNVGDTITFTVTLTNNGPDAATNVQVTDLLPAGLTFVSAMPSQGTYSSASGVWTVGAVGTTVTPTLQIRATVVSPSSETNTATISHSDQFDPNTGNNQSGATVTPQQADLVVGKSVSDPTPNVGETIIYTVTVANSGPDDATGVALQDVLPVGVSYKSSIATEGSYDPATQTWTVGGVAVGVTQTLTITALVTSPNPQANTASISHSDQFDPDTSNNSDTASINPLEADLELIKTVNDPTPNVGETVTFTISLTNNGPNTATNVEVSDLLPTGLSFVSATPSQGSYSSGTGVWMVGTVAMAATPTLQIQAMVVSPDAQTNTATISASDQFDPDTGNNTADATVTPQQSDLALTKTVSNSTPNVGDTVTFTVTLANHGPDTATSVQVTDLLPTGLTFVSATPSQGTYSSGTGLWIVGAVPMTATPTLQIQATVVSPSAQTNTATISHSDQFDPDTTNNNASATETPQQSDLALSKTVSDATPNVGDTITFTVTLTNHGPDPATGVHVTDLLPSGLTFVSATPSQGSYSSATGVWMVGAVGTTAAPTLQIQATVVSPSAETNTATISHSDQFDPNAGNNSADATVTPQQSDLALSKTVNDATPNVGDTVTFTVTLTNAGPDPATNVQVSDPLPAGLTFVSATPSQGSYSSSSGVWSVGTVTTTQTLLIRATVVSPNAETNTATISHSDQFDPDTSNNSGNATVTPQQSDLNLTKSVNNSTPNVGDTVTFTVALSNNGPDPATGVEITDLLPAGLTFVMATPSQGSYNSGTGLWTVGTVTTTDAPTLQIQATVVSPNAETNTATISHSDQFDPNTGNNTGDATVTPQQSDLALSKTVSDATPNVGDTVTFTVTLTNHGPDAATNVQVSDLLPAGLTFVSSTPSQGTYSSGTGLWTVGTVAANATPTLQIQATVVGPSAETNTATISHSDQFDPNPGNNQTEATVTPQQADLVVGKRVSNPKPNVGDTITFTVTVTNDGPDAATGVQVTDLLPAGLTFVSATPSQGSYNSGTGLWTVGTVAANATPTLHIQATVVSPGPETNTATISAADQFDPDPGNNSGSITVTPQQADLALTKTVNDPTPNVGGTVRFTITLTNHGPDAATNVRVADALPAGLTLVAAMPSQGTYAAGVWTVGTVGASAAPTLIITARVTSPNPETNTATISHVDQFDPNTGNNSASATVTPPQADLALSKTVSPTHVMFGMNVTYTFVIRNLGPSTATGVKVSDPIPHGLVFVSAAPPSQGTYNPARSIWNVGTLANGAVATLHVTFRVMTMGNIVNTAHASALEFDPALSNNVSSVIVVGLNPATIISKRSFLASNL